MNLFRTFGRTPWTGDQPDARPLPTQDNTTQKNADTHIHASSGIRNHDPSFRAVEDSTCLRLRGHWDRLTDLYKQKIINVLPVSALNNYNLLHIILRYMHSIEKRFK
jgi:hypothetical protein